MNVYVLFIATLVIISCMLFENKCETIDKEKDMDKPLTLCGSKLFSTLNSICNGKLIEHNTHGNNKGAPPKKGKIVDECCYAQCTLRHLSENYCVHNDKNNQSTLTTSTRAPKIETTTFNDKKSWWFYPIGAGPWVNE